MRLVPTLCALVALACVAPAGAQGGAPVVDEVQDGVGQPVSVVLPGMIVLIRGRNFPTCPPASREGDAKPACEHPGLSVTLAGRPAVVLASSADTITATVPPAAPPGAAVLRVRLAGRGEAEVAVRVVESSCTYPSPQPAWARALEADAPERRGHDLTWVARFEDGRADAASFAAYAAPVAAEQLAYLGYVSPPTCFPYDGVHAPPPGLRRPHHVYRYGERFAVLTASDGRRDQLIAYAVLRAFELLRRREAPLFEALFVGPQTPAAQLARIRARDPDKPVRFLNLTRAIAVVIDGGGPAIARSNYDLGTREVEAVAREGAPPTEVDVFRNVGTIYLDRAAIEGHGSRELYGGDDLTANFVRYLRDGLVETLVHEGLHLLLRRDKNVRDLFWAITTSARELGGEPLGMACEEAFVANVSSRLLAGRGLDPAVTRYYQRLAAGPHRAGLGLAEGAETDGGVALRALIARHRPNPSAPYEELFTFDPLDPGPRRD